MSADPAALVIIDVQAGLFSPPPANATAVVARINALIRRAREANAPVVFVQHESPGGSLMHETAGWQLVDTLDAQDEDLRVRKTTPDSFLRTSLADQLNGFGIRHIAVCGYATEFCVDTTVRRAAGLGYSVTLAADAHTTHDKPHGAAERIVAHHNATLADIESYGVPIRALDAEHIRFSGATRQANWP